MHYLAGLGWPIVRDRNSVVVHQAGRLLLVAMVLLLALGAVPAVASNEDYDKLNGVTFGDTPWSSAAPSPPFTAVFDSSSFSVSSDEKNNFGTYLGCQAWGSKTGWVRFATAVAGNLHFGVDTDYDVMYHVFLAPGSIAGTASLTQLMDKDCQNFNTTGGEEYSFGYDIAANQTIYVQTASKCASAAGGQPLTYPCDQAAQDNAPAGLTKVTLRFTPYDQDQDGVADTLDGCPAEAGSVGGCPDRDGDGVADGGDGCPDQIGHAADGCRLPDEDGDGYRVDGASVSTRDCNDDASAIHPGAAEILGNDVDEDCDGFAAFDRDGDRVIDAPAGPDCDPRRKGVHPGAVDVPGNALDEDCSGSALPYPHLGSRVAAVFGLYRDGVIRPLGFSILDVVRGMRIEIDCRGRGCPFSVQVKKVRKAATKLKVARALGHASKLAVGARLTVRLTLPGHVGRVIRYTVRSKQRKPRTSTGCLAAGSTTKELRRC